jgi:hypothetical protein
MNDHVRTEQENFGAGEFLDTYPEYQLCGYGFVYRRDRMSYGDDITWFLLERIHGAAPAA